MVRVLKKQLKAEIHFVTKAKYGGLLRPNPYIDRLWTFEKDIVEISSALKEEGFDLLIDLHKNLRSHRLSFSLGIPSIRFNKLNLDKFLHIKMGINRLKGHHLIDRYFEALKPLNIEDDGMGMDGFYVSDTKELTHRLGIKKTYSAIVLGANYFTKRVPKSMIEALLRAESTNQFVLIGGDDVFELGRDLDKEHDNALNLCSTLTLDESTAIIDSSQIVVSGDTGMMHLAAACKKPIISVWGSTHPLLGMYPYYGYNWEDLNISLVNHSITCNPCSKIGAKRCPKKHMKCLTGQPEERLIEAFDRQTKYIKKTLS